MTALLDGTGSKCSGAVSFGRISKALNPRLTLLPNPGIRFARQAIQPGQGWRSSMDMPASGPESGLAISVPIPFQSIIQSGWRTFMHGGYDEALQHSQENADAMRNDPFVRRILQERKLGAQSLGWRIEVDNERDPYEKAIKDGLTKLYKAIPRATDRRNALLEAVFFGRYASQASWEYRTLNLPAMPKTLAGITSRPADGETQPMRALTMALHRPLHGDKIGHDFDGNPYVLVSAMAALKAEREGAEVGDVPGYYPTINAKSAVYGYTTAGGKALFLRSPSWRQRFAIHQHECLDEEFWQAEKADAIHGVGIRSVIYWYWWLRQEFLSNVTDWCARTGLGVRLWYYASGNQQSFQKVSAAAKQQDDKVNILIPRTQENPVEGLDFVETSGTGADLLLKIIEHLEDHISVYVVGQSMSTGQDNDSGLGGTGRANYTEKTQWKITKFDAAKLGDTETEDTLKPMLRWTYGKQFADLPVRLVFNVDNPDPEAYLAAAKTFVEMGGTMREDDARAVLGFQAPHDGDKLLGGQQPGGQPVIGPDEQHHPGDVQPHEPQQPQNGQPAQQQRFAADEVQRLRNRVDEIRNEVQRFVAEAKTKREGSPMTTFEGKEGWWRQLGAKHGGGSPVFITKGGEIAAGHPSLKGRSIQKGQLSFGASGGTIPEDIRVSAKEEGIAEKDVNGLAHQMLVHDQEFKKDAVSLIRQAKVAAERLGVSLNRNNRAFQEGDWTTIPRFDKLASSMAREFPHILGEAPYEESGEESTANPAGKLIELLRDGSSPPMTHQQAYEAALDHLREVKESGQYDVPASEEDAGDFPFGANAPEEEHKPVNRILEKPPEGLPTGSVETPKRHPAEAFTEESPTPAKAEKATLTPEQKEQAKSIGDKHVGIAQEMAKATFGKSGIRDKNVLDDLTSEAYVGLMKVAQRAVAKGVPSEEIPGYLGKGIKNHLIDEYGKSKRLKRGGDKIVKALQEGDDVAEQEKSDAETSEENTKNVREAIGRLSEEHKSILTDQVAGMTNRDIAAKLGIGLGTVNRRLAKAKEALREEIERAHPDTYEAVMEVARYMLGEIPERYNEVDTSGETGVSPNHTDRRTTEPQRYGISGPILPEVWSEIVEQSKLYGPRAADFIRAVMEQMAHTPSQWEAIVRGRQAFLGGERYERQSLPERMEEAKAAIGIILNKRNARVAVAEAAVRFEAVDRKRSEVRNIADRAERVMRKTAERHQKEQEVARHTEMERQREEFLKTVPALLEKIDYQKKAEPEMGAAEILKAIRDMPAPVVNVQPIDVKELAKAIKELLPEPAKVKAKSKSMTITGPGGKKYTVEVE